MDLTQKCIFNTSKLSVELEYSKRMKVSLEMKFLFFSTLRFAKIFFFPWSSVYFCHLLEIVFAKAKLDQLEPRIMFR